MKEANSLKLSKYRLEKANKTLLEIDILIQNELILTDTTMGLGFMIRLYQSDSDQVKIHQQYPE